jgi:PTH2 family peptidyl-tRNA hydrolase
MSLDIIDLTEEDILAQALANSRPDDKPYYYQYAILRTDIVMETGKLLPQAGHAYTDALRSAEHHKPEVAQAYRVWCNEHNDAYNGGAKVAMKAKNSNQLVKAYNLARKAGIPCAIVVDRGHIYPPHFNGQLIITGLGIGPCTQEEAREITKRFTCF